MLEIFFLVRFARHLSKLAKAKGRSGGWAGLGVAMWFGGEVLGLIVGAAGDAGAAAYLLALVFAALGATAAYFIVKSLRPAEGMLLDPADRSPLPGVFVPTTPDLANPYAPPRAS
jgi:hypothetical protein